MTVTPEQKVAARKALNHAVAAGCIAPQPCVECGASPAQGHHPDYSKPLDVVWLCPHHHSVLHNQKHPLTKACEACGATYTPHPTKRARSKTCSEACRRVLQGRTTQRYPSEKPCTVCGRVFTPPPNARHRRTTCGQTACIKTARLRSMRPLIVPVAVDLPELPA